MYRVFNTLLATTAVFLALVTSSNAQEAAADTAHTMVISANKCYSGSMSELMEWTNATFAPAFDRLVDEGKLLGYGILDHAWGDEWNLVIYYQARDIPSFLSAFDEGIAYVNEIDSTALEQFTQFCNEHRDSIYQVARMVGGGVNRPAAEAGVNP